MKNFKNKRIIVTIALMFVLSTMLPVLAVTIEGKIDRQGNTGALTLELLGAGGSTSTSIGANSNTFKFDNVDAIFASSTSFELKVKNKSIKDVKWTDRKAQSQQGLASQQRLAWEMVNSPRN